MTRQVSHNLYILGHAKRDIKKAHKIHPKMAPLLFAACRDLATDPRPEGCAPVERHKGVLWRVKVEDYRPTYRIIYAIRDEIPAVIIVAVRPRDEETYKNIPLKDLGDKLKELQQQL